MESLFGAQIEHIGFSVLSFGLCSILYFLCITEYFGFEVEYFRDVAFFRGEWGR